MDLKGRRAVVIGLGKSGFWAAEFLARMGARVFVSEKGEERSFMGRIEALGKLGVQFEFGTHTKEVILSSDLIVLSPGVRGDMPLIVEAKKRGIEVIGEMELGFRWMRDVVIIAVTGTNGKTTTTRLISHILHLDGRRVVTCGNIGYPVTQALHEIREGDFVVMEVSSFQLETISTFTPKVGVVLNVREDHLDRYKGLDEYREVKMRIFENQMEDDFMVINADDPHILALARERMAKPIHFSKREGVEEGVFLEGERIVYRIGSSEKREIIAKDEMSLVGSHNLENAMAAIASTVVVDVGLEALKEALRTFPPLPHRIEDLGLVGGVRFINDSKATNVDATLKALDTIESPILLIAGGKDKGMNYQPLSEPVKRKVKALILIGEVKERMASEVGAEEKTHLLPDLERAVELAYDLACEGDTVLLSPASSSQDQFIDFEERGNLFKEIVNRIREGLRGKGASRV
jgi:UDP-N-acetylmuramoylalanine--D-glutamate ligase